MTKKSDSRETFLYGGQNLAIWPSWSFSAIGIFAKRCVKTEHTQHNSSSTEHWRTASTSPKHPAGLGEKETSYSSANDRGSMDSRWAFTCLSVEWDNLKFDPAAICDRQFRFNRLLGLSKSNSVNQGFVLALDPAVWPCTLHCTWDNSERWVKIYYK